MTRTRYARLAGFMFLFLHCHPGMTGMIPVRAGNQRARGWPRSSRTSPSTWCKCAYRRVLAAHGFNALVLAVALYAVTREQHPDLAVLALSCRVGEGVLSAIPTLATLGLLWLATTAAAAPFQDAAAANGLGALLLKVRGWGLLLSALLFAVGSALYSYLFLRARTIPVALAWLGIFASVLLMVCLPPQLAGFIEGRVDAPLDVVTDVGIRSHARPVAARQGGWRGHRSGAMTSLLPVIPTTSSARHNPAVYIPDGTSHPVGLI